MTPLERRILDISYKYKLSHIGSCLSAVGIIDDIYKRKKPKDKFVLSCGHAGVALYAVLEKYLGLDAEKLFESHGVHPNRNECNGIDCSTGSLGQGICIALGMALADRSRDVYCLLSDGELYEGSVYEALNNKTNNLKIYCNYNGWSAYDDIQLSPIFKAYGVDIVDTRDHWFMQKYGQEAHYKILSNPEYEEIIRS